MVDDGNLNFNNFSDEQLLEAYLTGHKEAFAVLVERYRLMLFHFLARFIGDKVAADDIFQEAFLQVHLSADRFDPSRQLKPWIFTIAANKARDYLRKVNRLPPVLLSATINDSSTGESLSFMDLLQCDLPRPDQQSQQREQGQKVREAINQMPSHLREILLLAYFEQFSYKEMAQILSIPVGTVKSRLNAAVAKFAKNWTTQGNMSH